MGQSKRSHALALVRWRRQAANLLSSAQLHHVYLPPSTLHPKPSPTYFDVPAARELAARMIAMADEQTVFEDWCRDRGLGPETTASPAYAPPGWRELGLPFQGGWPGVLARQYPGKSDAAMGRSLARVGQRLLDMLNGRCAWAPSARAQSNECQECPPVYVHLDTLTVQGEEQAQRQHLDGALALRHRAPHVIASVPADDAHLAVVDFALSGLTGAVVAVTINGTSTLYAVGVSEWRTWHRQAVKVSGDRVELSVQVVELPCSACHGTGRNMRGFIPEIELPPHLLRRAADIHVAAVPPEDLQTLPVDTQWPEWMRELGIDTVAALSWSRRHVTRVGQRQQRGRPSAVGRVERQLQDAFAQVLAQAGGRLEYNPINVARLTEVADEVLRREFEDVDITRPTRSYETGRIEFEARVSRPMDNDRLITFTIDV